MTPLEQHIYVEQKIQKIASNQNRDILVEELDFALNIAQMEILKERSKFTERNTGFAIDVRQLSDIDDVIVKNYPMTVYIDPAGGDPNSLPAFCIFPPDYFALVNDRSRVYTDCQTNFNQNTTSNTTYLYYITFPNTVATSNYYNNVTMTIDGTTVVTNVGAGVTNEVYSSVYPYQSADDKFMIASTIVELCNQLRRNNEVTFQVFWERYNTIYKKDTFIVVKSSAITLPTFSYTGGSPVITSATLTNNIFTTTSYEYENPNRFINNEYLPVILKRYHSRTQQNTPVSSIANNNLQVFYNTSFIINKVLIDYIRKPNKISLPLNRSCELAEPLQYEICDRAAEILMLDTANPLYQLKQQRNLTHLN